MKLIYRKRVLLAITQSFGGELSATHFQKLLFLFTERQVKKNYDFVPYRFGCFSFQAMADKSRLMKDGFLEDVKNWKITSCDMNFASTLNDLDRKELTKFRTKYHNFSTKELIREIYLTYPYYAINSEIAEKYLDVKEGEAINKLKPNDVKTSLFTIGYEGRTLEIYLNLLIQNNIKVLCDVRKNPLSMKYGFSKKTLQNACETLNIKYIHLPELGIESRKRQNLKTQCDYDSLFQDYEKTVLHQQIKAITFIIDLLNNYNRVALTCFEYSPRRCHRTRVANAVHSLDETIPLKHL
ncbi:MAG: DUF488 domain-containing protein [Candidatus Cloacimonetes bacterium]|nr:DUF488 domain-containing protein [Candidatus Cloacimonadota bacterium]